MPTNRTRKTSPPSLSDQLSKIIAACEKQDRPSAALLAAAEELWTLPAFDEAKKAFRFQEDATALAKGLQKTFAVLAAIDDAREALRVREEAVAAITPAQQVFDPVQWSFGHHVFSVWLREV